MPAPGRGDRAARPITTEFDFDRPGEDIDLDPSDEDTEGRPVAIGDSVQTADTGTARHRRITTTSPISARLAERMLPMQAPDSARVRRDPAAPQEETEQYTRRVGEDDTEHTRRVGDSDRRSIGSGGWRPARTGSQDVDAAACRQRAAALIDGARAAMDDGDVRAAVTAAESALREADEAPAPGIVEVIEPARPLLARVFSTYVGPLGGVPVLAPGANEIARACLGERERALIARIDGMRTLGEIFDGSGLGSTEALRLTARMIRAGAVRVI
jgi:hypothetical protein